MKPLIKPLIPLVTAAAILTGCNTSSQQDRAVGGAVLGGAAGAVAGGVATGTGTGALVGGGLGAVGGAVVGAATTPSNCVDRYGRRVPCP